MIVPPLLTNLVFLLFSSCPKNLVLQLQFSTWFFASPGLRFEEVIDAEVWHYDVKLYSVFDLNSGELIGYFFLDLYTRFDQNFKLLQNWPWHYFFICEWNCVLYLVREEKYIHTCVVALQSSALLSNGTRQVIFVIYLHDTCAIIYLEYICIVYHENLTIITCTLPHMMYEENCTWNKKLRCLVSSLYDNSIYKLYHHKFSFFCLSRYRWHYCYLNYRTMLMVMPGWCDSLKWLIFFMSLAMWYIFCVLSFRP